jgi:acyl-CoA synthetase
VVATHPAVAVAAAVAMPDPLFGERVCVFVELKHAETLDLPRLIEHLRRLGVSKELLPERLEVLDALPRSSGGKVAKGQLREDIRSTLEPS